MNKLNLGFLLIFFFFFSKDLAVLVDVDSDLIYHFKFQNNFVDSINNVAPLSECPANREFTENQLGEANSAVYFKGTDCTCFNEIDTQYFPNMDSFTVTYWVKYDEGAAGDSIFSMKKDKDQNTADSVILLHYKHYILYQHTQTAGNLQRLFGDFNGIWSHVAIIRYKEDNKVKMYLNGLLVYLQEDLAGTASLKPNFFSFGKSVYYQSKCGNKASLSDFRIYNKALNMDQIRQLRRTIQPNVFASTCAEASKDTSLYLDTQLNGQDHCIKYTCLALLPTMLKGIIFPNQSTPIYLLKLTDALDYDESCFELHSEHVEEDGVLASYVDELNLYSLRFCPTSPCTVNFKLYFRDSPFLLQETNSQVAYPPSTSYSVYEAQAISSTTVSRFNEQAIIIGETERVFGNFQPRKQSDYLTTETGDLSIGSDIFYVFSTIESGLNLTKEDINVTLVNPTNESPVFELTSSQFELQAGTALDEYKLQINANYYPGSYKVKVTPK